jgi:hypothetical protein
MSKLRQTAPVAPSEVLRQAIQTSGQSLYRLAKDSGLSYGSLWYFLAGERMLRQDSFDKLCLHLGLTLTNGKRSER